MPLLYVFLKPQQQKHLKSALPFGKVPYFLGKYDEFSVNIWVPISKIAMPLKGDTVIVNHLISDSILQKLL